MKCPKCKNDMQEGFIRVNGFSDGMISCLIEDKSGKIWVGTRNFNVDRYEPRLKDETGNGKAVTNFSEKEIAELIDASTELIPSDRKIILQSVQQNISQINQTKYELWHALRKILSFHRSHPGAWR